MAPYVKKSPDGKHTITSEIENEIEAGYTGKYQLTVSFDRPIMGTTAFRAMNVSETFSADSRFGFLYGTCGVLVIDYENATAAFVRFPDDLSKGAVAPGANRRDLLIKDLSCDGRDVRVRLYNSNYVAQPAPDVFEAIGVNPPAARWKPGFLPRFDFH